METPVAAAAAPAAVPTLAGCGVRASLPGVAACDSLPGVFGTGALGVKAPVPVLVCTRTLLPLVAFAEGVLPPEILRSIPAVSRATMEPIGSRGEGVGVAEAVSGLRTSLADKVVPR